MTGIKQAFCTITGLLGGAAAWAFGGWDTAMAALVICMAVDFLSGSIIALVFQKSTKTASGAYDPTYGLKGLCKKCMMLLFVLVAVQIDKLLSADYVRNAVCIAFCTNEILSIVENLGTAGVPLPKVIAKALDQLGGKSAKS